MKKLLLVLLPLLFVIGCGAPYKDSAFRTIQTSRYLNEAVNHMGSTMYQLDLLSNEDRDNLKEALDEQIIQHKISGYALERYDVTYGMVGYAPIETELRELDRANKKIIKVIVDVTGGIKK